MNKKSLIPLGILAIPLIVSAHNAVPLSAAAVSDLIAQIRPNNHTFLNLCSSSSTIGRCTMNDVNAGSQHNFEQLYYSTGLSEMLGVPFSVMSQSGALTYIPVVASSTALANGPTLSFNGYPGASIYALLIGQSGQPISPQYSVSGYIVGTQFQPIASGSGSFSFSTAPIFGTGLGPVAGEVYHLLCYSFNTTSGQPVSINASAITVTW